MRRLALARMAGPGPGCAWGWAVIVGRSGLWLVAACCGPGAGDPGGDGQHRAGVLAGEPVQDAPVPGAEFEAGQRAGEDLGLFGVWHESSGGSVDGPVRHWRRLGWPCCHWLLAGGRACDAGSPIRLASAAIASSSSALMRACWSAAWRARYSVTARRCSAW